MSESHVGHTTAIRALAVSQDEHWLVSGDDLGWVWCWDLEKRRKPRVIRRPVWRGRGWAAGERPRLALPVGIEDLCFTTGGLRVVVALTWGGLEIYDLESGRLERRLPGFEAPLVPDGMRVWAQAKGRYFRVDPGSGGWNLEREQPVCPAVGLSFQVEEGVFRSWNLESGEELPTVPIGAGTPLTAALSPDGARLAWLSEDSKPEGWSPTSLRILDRTTGQICTLAVYPTVAPSCRLLWGIRLLFVVAGGRVDRWDPEGILVGSSPDPATALVLGPQAIWGDERGQLRFLGRDPRWAPPLSAAPVPIVAMSQSWPLVSLRENGLLQIGNGDIRLIGGKPLAVHPEGIRAATERAGRVWIWEVAEEKSWCLGEIVANGAVLGGTRIALWGQEQVEVWDLGRRSGIFQQQVESCCVVALSADGTQLALGSGANGRVEVVDLQTGLRQILEGEEDRRHGVASLSFSTDGQKLGIGGVGAWAECWALDAVGGGQHFPLPTDGVQIAMGPDGKMAGLLSYDPLIWFGDGVRAHARFVPTGNGRCLSFLPDGRVAAATAAGEIEVWDQNLRRCFLDRKPI